MSTEEVPARDALETHIATRIVATDWANRNPRPMDFEEVHSRGMPHRAVHIEVFDEARRLLVWDRSDGRLEIPGGHVDWIEERGVAEVDTVAAARELLEELGAPTSERAVAALSERLVPSGCYFNQSQGGRNNEWVQVYSVDSVHLPMVGAGVLSAEGNRDPRWLSIAELEQHLTQDATRATSAMRACVARSAARC